MKRSASLIGQRFGLLTVIEKTDQLEDRYYTWLCKCDCGGEITVNTKRLTRGTITNCGCIPKSTAQNGTIPENLAGRQFGDLTALHQVSSKNGRTRWECKCSCGNLHIATSAMLKAGHVKNCGCKGKKRIGKMLDLTDQRFGRLVAEYPTKKRSYKGSVIWHCRCDCGEEVEVAQDNLVYGNSRSCGCLKREAQAEVHTHLDFIDGTCVQLLEHRKYRKDNTSGFRGVSQTKDNRWRVGIGFKKQRFYIGRFNTYEEAVQARLDAEEVIHNGFVRAYYAWLDRAKKDDAWAEANPFVYDVHKKNDRFIISTNIGNDSVFPTDQNTHI